ncbi:uncharacterized protein LOC130641062 [Hydractinia symbiolongicarpus]|uniref:uncharacterized protein LOC130641062 n=1 Tax=Hydractinia symbiolongicarpus TaxID=13093 RepID=UPI0025509ABF|nr:uncharacterized protein LOC130641062 [Hydractinia symbiolongicarpus]
MGLRRRIGQYESREEVIQAISSELTGSGKSLGYRKLWKAIKANGIPARRSSVMEILRELDPVGVESRAKKRLRRRIYSVPGPDFLWHLDGHDKLKPYGFSIHGCIDGFSRRLIWLEVGPTNKRPEVVANYFLEAVTQLNRLPTRIRSDDGTENSIIEAIQICMRADHTDEYAGLGSFIVGSSPNNQRIECFWSQLAKDRPMWWREFFAELSGMGYLDGGNVLIAQCARFCFMHLIRKDLDDMAVRWNQHIIAPSRGSTLPRRRPDTLHFIPELYNSKSYKKFVDISDISEFNDPTFAIAVADNEPEFIEFAYTVLAMKGHPNGRPSTIQQALEIYFLLLDAVAEFM